MEQHPGVIVERRVRRLLQLSSGRGRVGPVLYGVLDAAEQGVQLRRCVHLGQIADLLLDVGHERGERIGVHRTVHGRVCNRCAVRADEFCVAPQ